MEKLRELEGAIGFRILFLNWKGGLNKSRRIMKKAGCGIPVLIDCSGYGRKVLGVNYTPTLFVLDEEGVIRSRIVGAPEDIVNIVVKVLKTI